MSLSLKELNELALWFLEKRNGNDATLRVLKQVQYYPSLCDTFKPLEEKFVRIENTLRTLCNLLQDVKQEYEHAKNELIRIGDISSDNTKVLIYNFRD